MHNRKPNSLARTPQFPVRGTSKPTGFTLIELCVVLAISIILAAIAIPEVLNTYHSAQVRSAANEFSGLIQQASILAEQKNVTIPVYTGTVQNGANGVFVACSSSSCPSGGNGTSYQTGDAAVTYGGGVTNGAAGNAPSGLNPGIPPEAAGTTLYFSPRGVAETASGSGYRLSSGFVFYLTDSRNDWAAVTVSSIGRSKVWVWNGSGWN